MHSLDDFWEPDKKFQGNSEHCGWFFLGQDFAMEIIINCVFFLFSKAGKFS